MARDLNLSVTLSAINKATGPLKQIMQGSRGAGQAIRQTQGRRALPHDNAIRLYRRGVRVLSCINCTFLQLQEAIMAEGVEVRGNTVQDWIQKDLASRLANKRSRRSSASCARPSGSTPRATRRPSTPPWASPSACPTTRIPTPSRSEIEKILTTPTKRVQELNLIKFAIYDGPRISEVQALAWEDVLDVEKGIIRYRRAVVRSRFKVTKTKRSTRVHHLLKPAREALQEQYALTGKLQPRVYEVVDRDNRTVRKKKLRLVFLNSRNNQPFYENAIRGRFWKTHLKKASVRYRGPNQCRHTFISQLLSMGVVPLHWIANHVGHATITMIQRRYGKWIRSDGPDISALIEKHLEV